MKTNSEFLKNIFLMVSSTTFAQAIPLAVSPILTRVYSPGEFGVFAIYIAIFYVLSSFSTMRYELAIVQENQKNAYQIFYLCLLMSLIFFITSFFMIYLFREEISDFFKIQQHANLLFLIPISIFLHGFIQSLSFLFTRNKQFSHIASSKIMQGASGGLFQTLFGLLKNTFGLIFGFLISQLFALSALIYGFLRKRKVLPKLNIPIVAYLAKKYKRYPLVSTFGITADNASLQLPFFFVNNFFGSAITGFFSITSKVMNAPLSIIAPSISQVYYQKIFELKKISPHKAFLFTFKTFAILLLASLPFALIIFFFGEQIFSFIFGSEWAISGKYAQVLVFAAVIKFSVSPLSSVMSLKENIYAGTLWQVTYFISLFTTLYFLSKGSLNSFIIGFTIHEIILYSLYLFLILKGTKA